MNCVYCESLRMVTTAPEKFHDALDAMFVVGVTAAWASEEDSAGRDFPGPSRFFCQEHAARCKATVVRAIQLLDGKYKGRAQA